MNCAYSRTDNLHSADAARCPSMLPLVFGVRGCVAGHRLADPLTFCDGHGVSFVAPSGSSGRQPTAGLTWPENGRSIAAGSGTRGWSQWTGCPPVYLAYTSNVPSVYLACTGTNQKPAKPEMPPLQGGRRYMGHPSGEREDPGKVNRPKLEPDHRGEETWKIAEILILRHQLAVLQRQQPGSRRPAAAAAGFMEWFTRLGGTRRSRRRAPCRSAPARRAAPGHPRPDATAHAGGPPGRGVRNRAGWPGNAVTVRDGKRFAGPLALPGSCPLYVRDQWTDRTRGRKPRQPADLLEYVVHSSLCGLSRRSG
jgi:hypothetical protein